MYEILILLVSVILTTAHFYINKKRLGNRYKFLYFIQFGALFSCFSVAEYFLKKSDGQFLLGAAGFIFMVVNLLLMTRKNEN